MRTTGFVCMLLLIASEAAFSSSFKTRSADTTLPEELCDTLSGAKVEGARNLQASSAVPLSEVSSSQIERRGARQMSEVVRTLAGVSIRDYGGIGGLKTVSIRNLGTAHTLVCYDGFTVSDAQNGQVDISRFALDNVDRITVTAGGSDDIFRSARVMNASGVLSVSTTSQTDSFAWEDKPFQIKGGLSAGSCMTWNPTLHYSHIIRNRVKATADVNILSTKGNYPFSYRNGTETVRQIRMNSDLCSISTEMNIKADLGRSGMISAKASFFGSEKGLPGNVILYYQNPKERLRDRSTSVWTRHEGHWGNIWKTSVGISYSSAWNIYTDSNPSYSEPVENTYRQHETALSAIIGASPWENWSFSFAEDIFVNILDSDLAECPYPVRASSLSSLSAKYSSGMATVVANMTGLFAAEHFRKQITGKSVPAAMKRLSPSLCASLRLGRKRDILLRMSIKDSYRVPTFNDLYYSRVGNTSLRPEKAFTSNIGLTWQSDRKLLNLATSLDIYANYIRDKITAIPTMFIWRMRNIGKAVIAGADASLRINWRICSKVSVMADANCSFQYAVDITDKESKSWMNQIPYTPRHSGNLVASVSTFWFDIAYTLCCSGKRYSLPQNIPANLIPAWADHSISIGRTFKFSGVSLRTSAEALNLSGVNYQIISGYPMQGRSFRISLSLKY